MRFINTNVIATCLTLAILHWIAPTAQAQGPTNILRASGTTRTSSASYNVSAYIYFYADGTMIVKGVSSTPSAGTPIIVTSSGGWRISAASNTAITWQLTRSVGLDGFWLKQSLGGFVTVQTLYLDPGATVTLDASQRTLTINGSISRPYSTRVSCVLRF